MLELNKYRTIRDIKDSSPFTATLSLNLYIEDVRRRLGVLTGRAPKEVTLEEVYESLLSTIEDLT